MLIYMTGGAIKACQRFGMEAEFPDQTIGHRSLLDYSTNLGIVTRNRETVLAVWYHCVYYGDPKISTSDSMARF